MNFYDLIAKYKYMCNNELEANREDNNELTRGINEAKNYIAYLNSKFQVSPYLAGCSGIALIFCAMFTYFFESALSAGLFLSGVALSGIAVAQERAQERFQQHKQEWYKYYTDLNSDLIQVRLEEVHIKSLLNDVNTCCNYYMYLVDEASKSLPINIDVEEVIKSNCLLSTYLDKFYKGELEEFRKLAPSEKKRQERTNRIYERINAKRYPSGEEPQISLHRRRRQRRIYDEEQQKILQFPTQLKRRA